MESGKDTGTGKAIMPRWNKKSAPRDDERADGNGDKVMDKEPAKSVYSNLDEKIEEEKVVKLDDEVKILGIDLLEPFKNHHFKPYEGARFESLKNSIRENGFWGLIIVRPHPIQDGKYEILCGHNRYYAVKSLNQPTITAQIISGLSDDEALNMVNRDNYDQQSFLDWSYSQQLQVIKIRDRFIKDNSRQGERTDLSDAEGATGVHGEHKSDEAPKKKGKGKPKAKPKLPKTRDRIAKELGLSPTVFERYRSISKLDDDTLAMVGKLLDDKKISFMSGFYLSKLKPSEIATAIEVINNKGDVKIKTVNFKALLDARKAFEEVNGSEKSMTKKEVREVLSKVIEPASK